MKLIDQKLDLELSAFICGWHEYEARIGGEEIIDMALSDKVEPKTYAYRYEVLQDIERFLTYEEVKNHDIILRKLTSHRYFLLRLMGEMAPSDEYLENTMGIKPILYSDEKIKALRENTDALLAPLGLRMQENISDDLNALDSKIPQEQITKFFDENHNRLYQHIRAKTGIDVGFEVNYTEIDKDIPIWAQIQGNGRNYDVRLNMFYMRQDTAYTLQHLSSHELTGHGVQFAALRQQADQGMMPRYLTYMTVHEPIQFGAEGLAETLPYFYPEMFEQTPIALATNAVHRLKRAVSNNASTRANRGEKLTDCVEYIYENAPNWSRARTAQSIGATVNKPLGSSYFQVYSQGIETFLDISKTHPDKNSFIKSVYEGFLMPEQIQAQSKNSIVHSI